ncbi:helix-turn-helix domain-containing protein [Streptomyces sp. NPDC058459]|uniref:helix-turn-helix domain-containing protein n=1 Tax=Streptomyces sp. NPDC058459 TaxID=3346508 RepID=UPI0036550D97
MTLLREPAVAAGESIKQSIPIGLRDRADDDGAGAALFGRRLRDLRLGSGLSQKQLARSSTLSVRAIRDLENGRVRHPRADSLRLLADALGLSARQLKGLANDHSRGCPAGVAEPTVSGPFIGREQELAALTTMLGPEHHRLITVAGIEGVGKSRLAWEVAHALEAAEHATVLWLPLHDDRLRSGQAPGGAPDHPTWWPDSRRRLAETIGKSNSILVLDGARPEDELTDVTAHLLAICPRLRILVTTRNPVGMPLDTVFPLAPLSVPSPDVEAADLDSVASVALLLAQTKRIRPALRPDLDVLTDIARICRALDGLPAALESAAYWNLIYSPRELAHQLAVEPFAVARRPPGSHQRSDAYASVQHTVATLSSRQRALLSIMSHKPSRETDGYWSVAEVADEMGLSVADCADDIYHLVILGILHRVDRHDVAMFRVLNIVCFAEQRALAGRNDIAGQRTAA